MAGALRELLASFGFEVDSAPLSKADDSLNGLMGSVRKLGAVIAGAAGVIAIKRFVSEQVAAGSEIHDTAIQIGLSAHGLQQWRHIAGLAGVENGQLTQSLGLLSRNAFEAANGGREQARTFQRLGVSVRGADGQLKDAGTLFEEVGIAIGGLDNPTERTAMALQIFGRAGKALLPVFAEGAEGTRRLAREFDELGGGMSDEAVAAADELGDNFDRINLISDSLKSRIAVVLLPILNTFVEKIIGLGKRFVEFTRGTRFVEIALAVLGAVAVVTGIKLLAAFAGPLLVIGLIAAGIIAISLLVEDFIAFLEGRESVFGELIQQAFGPEAVESVRNFFNVTIPAGINFVISQLQALVATASGGFMAIGNLLLQFLLAPLNLAGTGVQLLTDAIWHFAAQSHSALAMLGAGLVEFLLRPITMAKQGLADFLNLARAGASALGISVGGGAAPAARPAVATPGRGGNRTVQQVNRTSVTVHAGAASAPEVAAAIDARIAATRRRDLSDARAALEHVGGEF